MLEVGLIVQVQLVLNSRIRHGGVVKPHGLELVEVLEHLIPDAGVRESGTPQGEAEELLAHFARSAAVAVEPPVFEADEGGIVEEIEPLERYQVVEEVVGEFRAVDVAEDEADHVELGEIVEDSVGEGREPVVSAAVEDDALDVGRGREEIDGDGGDAALEHGELLEFGVAGEEGSWGEREREREREREKEAVDQDNAR